MGKDGRDGGGERPILISSRVELNEGYLGRNGVLFYQNALSKTTVHLSNIINEGALEQNIIDPNSTDRCRSQSNGSIVSFAHTRFMPHLLIS
ncbi:unnamed protein product [Onchocerca flexuosa]|uniref:Pectate lyase n=1 Tax=Onchocerca flexuosa TaxID=387005 RepID=A0A183HD83_9BILA|nr:unnamed protein product [Onchocerca flexuosa]